MTEFSRSEAFGRAHRGLVSLLSLAAILALIVLVAMKETL